MIPGELNNLFRQMRPKLLRYFEKNVANRNEAEDLTQEALLAAFRNRASFRGDSTVRTWIFAIAKNTLRKYYRNSRYRSLPSRLGDAIADSRNTDMQRMVLRLMVEELSSSDRELYEQFYVKRMTIHEIAQSLGKPEGTVKHRLFAIRRHLQR